MTSPLATRNYQMLKAKLILRLVRACVAADVANDLGVYDNQDLILRINTDPEFRCTLLAMPAVQECLEELHP